MESKSQLKRRAIQQAAVGDFSVNDQGTIVLLTPLTVAAREWVDQNLQDERFEFGGAIVIDHRLFGDLAAGIKAKGLTLA